MMRIFHLFKDKVNNVHIKKAQSRRIVLSDCIETLISAEPKLGFRLF